MPPAFAIDQPMRVGLGLSEGGGGIGGVGERGREGKEEEGLKFSSCSWVSNAIRRGRNKKPIPDSVLNHVV